VIIATAREAPAVVSGFDDVTEALGDRPCSLFSRFEANTYMLEARSCKEGFMQPELMVKSLS
jgi:hypothetical protein